MSTITTANYTWTRGGGQGNLMRPVPLKSFLSHCFRMTHLLTNYLLFFIILWIFFLPLEVPDRYPLLLSSRALTHTQKHLSFCLTAFAISRLCGFPILAKWNLISPVNLCHVNLSHRPTRRTWKGRGKISSPEAPSTEQNLTPCSVTVVFPTSWRDPLVSWLPKPRHGDLLNT